MTALPEPLTPPDCDLRGMPYMPVDLVRLFDSDLFALSTGDEFKAAFCLWGKSFLQVPAGSVPDDDRILAHLTGTGARWVKLRAMALRGWVKCSDGRLYHPVVAQKAKDAWEARLAQRARTEAARAAKRASQASTPVDRNPVPAPMSVGNSHQPIEKPKPALSVTRTVAEVVTGSKGEGELSKKERITPPPPSASGSPKGGRLPSDWKPNEIEAGYADKLGLNPEAVAENFRDYWHAKAGADGRKADWSATWRTWCRRDAERKQNAPRFNRTESKAAWMFETSPSELFQ